MTQLPSAQLAAPLLHHPVLRLAQQIEPALGQKIQRQRESRQPVGQYAVMNVAAGGVVAGQGRRLLPGFAPAARVLVIEVRQCLPADQPESLHEKERQQSRRDALRQIEAKAAKHAKSVGHYDPSNPTSLNAGLERSSRALSILRRHCLPQAARKQESRPEGRLSWRRERLS